MLNKHSNLAFFIPHLGCPYRCIFCDQNNISGEDDIIKPDEVRKTCDEFLPADGKGTEIAFFGGSFTAIPREQMVSFLEAAYPFVRDGRAEGIRLSTRPDCIDDEVLSVLKRYGVTSIELGAQSMDDHVLKVNGRGHTSDDVRKASELICEYGFSLGLQMMVGMYGAEDPEKDALYTAKEFMKLSPDTVRIYPTIVVNDTVLASLWRSGRYIPLDVEDAVRISAKLITKFREAGINVIRVGLHSEESLQKQALAGPFHPAFGEMCESRIIREQIDNAIGDRKDIIIRCNPKLVSQVIGQKKSNISYLSEKGVHVSIVQDTAIDRFEIE